MTGWMGALTRLDRRGDVFSFAEPEAPQGRLFGGMIAAQALWSAHATVEGDKAPQSLHAYFVRGGRPGITVDYEVERTRDGRSFDTRRVTARQGDDVILELLASFHRPEPGGVDEHPSAPPGGSVDEATPVRAIADLDTRFEMRSGGEGPGFTGPPFWIRLREPGPTSVIGQAFALTYMSDIGIMAAARPSEMPLDFTKVVAASLDHAVWFHRPFHADRWHRYETRRLNHNDARGLAVGAFYDTDGSLIASMTQEALWRVRTEG